MLKLRQFLKVAPVILGLTLASCNRHNSDTTYSDSNNSKILRLENIILKSTSLIKPNTSSIEISNNAHQVYDSITNIFVSKEGGIDEDILNKYCDEYKNDTSVHTIQLYDDFERQTIFYSHPILTEVKTLQNEAVYKNIIIIDALLNDSVYDVHIGKHVRFDETLHSEYLPLRKLAAGMATICYNEKNEMLKLKKAYNLIGKYIQPGCNTAQTMDILYLTNDNLGNCDDLTSAYTTLLRYCGFDVIMPLSFITSNYKTSVHTWLQVKVEDKIFDLDPTWHLLFMPLNPRLKLEE